MALSNYYRKLRNYLRSLPVRRPLRPTMVRRWAKPRLEVLEDRLTPSGSWVSLTNPIPDSLGAQQMLLLPNGNVLVAGGSDSASANWYLLYPDGGGDYYDGKFSAAGAVPSMNVARLFYTSDILPNGNVLVEGGEYSGPVTAITGDPRGEIYNPSTNAPWQLIAPDPQNYGSSAVVSESEVGNTVTMTTNSPIGSPFKFVAGVTVLISGFAPSTLNGSFTVTAASNTSTSTTFSYVDPQAANVSATTFGGAAQQVFGDDPSEVLSNGTVLMGVLGNPAVNIYNPTTNVWTTTGSKLNGDRSDEETWVKLPPQPGQTDGDILSYDVYASPFSGPGFAQYYNPSTGIWSPTGPVPVALSDPGNELGPAFLLPSGNVIQIGANGNTAIYTPSTNSWVQGPSVPVAVLGAADAPGAELPDGEVIFTANTPNQKRPSDVFDYNPYNLSQGPNGTITQLTLPSALAANLNTNGNSTNSDYMLVLPDGHVLFSDSTKQLWDYNPNVTPLAASAPNLTGITQTGQGAFISPATVVIDGTQLNGISEGANYGDDGEMASNYPILAQYQGGGVTYWQTSNWNTASVATGNTIEQANGTLPAIPSSGEILYVSAIANGIASPTVLNIEMSTQLNDVTLQEDPNNFQDLEILESGSFYADVPFNSFSSIIVSGGINQTNTLIVNYADSFINDPITFDGSLVGATNNLTVTDSGGVQQPGWTVTNNDIASGYGTNVYYAFAQSVTLDTGNGGTVNVDSTALNTTTNIGAAGPTTIVVGNNGLTSSILGPLILYNPLNLNTITVDDSNDSFTRTATLSSLTSGGGLPLPDYGNIAGLSIGAIEFAYGSTAKITIETGTGMETVNVQASQPLAGGGGGPITLQGNSPTTFVNIGNNKNLNLVQGPLSITNPDYYTQVTVNDQADMTSYSNVQLNATTLSGLGNATISFGPDDLAGLTINGGSGANTYTITTTQFSFILGGNLTTLNTGTGNDTVDVHGESGNGLTVAAQGGSTTVNIGLNNHLTSLGAAVTVDSSKAAMTVVVNASADGGNFGNVQLSSTGLSGLAGGPINFTGVGKSLTVNAGNGQNTYTVTGDPFSQMSTLATGNGPDIVNINGTAYPLTLDTGSHTTSISVGQAAKKVSGIHGALTISGSTPGADLLFVYDTADTVGGTVTVSNTGVSGLSTMPPMSFGASTLGDLNVNAGTGGTGFVLASTPATGWNMSALGTGNTLTGFNSNANWMLAQSQDYITSTATTYPVYFSGFQTLTAGSANDDFEFNGGLVFQGSIDGGGGSNTMDFSQTSYPVRVYISGPGTSDGNQGTATALTNTFNNIGTFINATETAGLVVTTNSDSPSHGGTSLRDAIAEGNMYTSEGIPASITFAFSVNNLPISLQQGLLEITAGSASLSIIGINGLNIVNGAAHSGIFQVDSGATATISGLIIEDGGTSGNGGGILNNGILTLNDDQFLSNSATGNGAGIDNSGVLTLYSNLLAGNDAGGKGGAIYNSGTLTSTFDYIDDNKAAGDGGGGFYGYNSSAATFTNDIISNNTATTNDGGGMYFFGGSAAVIDSNFHNNSAVDDGGGVFNYFGTLWINGDTFFENAANNTTDSYSSGGGMFNEGYLTMLNSTFNNNAARNYGGGMFNQELATLTNDTFTANYTYLGDGGAIYNGSSNALTLTNDTISLNTAQQTGGGIYQSGNEGPLTLENTIVAENREITPVNNSFYPDISGTVSNNPASSDNNIIGSDPTNTSGLTNGTLGNQVGVNPLLLSIADNGGPTQTMALPAASTAIGGGDAPATINAPGGGINSSTTSVQVSDAAAFAATNPPTGDGFVIAVDSEQMLVTGVNLSNNTLTVQRGYNGTTPASHPTGEGAYLTADQRGDSRLNTLTPDVGAYQTPITQPSGLVVTTVSDGPTHNGVSLRDAITLANSMSASGQAATITFARRTFGFPIVLDQAPLELKAGPGVITINGAGQTAVSGSYIQNTVFVVDNGANVDLTGLTIEQGQAVNGGGVNNAGTLTLNSDTLSGNSATGMGGALYNSGSASVSNTTFSGNSASAAGPDIENAGGTTTLAGGVLVVPNSAVGGGVLQVDGHLFSPATVSVSAGAVVDGNGFIAGTVSVNGTLTAGDGGATGMLTANGMSFGAGGVMAITLDGYHTGSGFDQIISNGTVNLTNAALQLSLGAGFNPTVGSSFDILFNDSGFPIVGTFNGLPDGGLYTVGGHSFAITYRGGTSDNDVTLTDVLPTTASLIDNGPNPSSFGQPVSLTIMLTGGVPNGELVTIKDVGSGATVGMGTVSGGKATTAVSDLAPGVRTLVAVYGGDATLSGSTSNTVMQTVNEGADITSANSATFSVGAFNSFLVTAGGYPTPSISENPSDMLPSGVGFDPSTDMLNGTPALGSIGTYTLHFTATNAYGSGGQTFTLTVGQAVPVITWNTPSPITYGTPLDNTELDAAANVPGTFVYTPAAGTVLPAVNTPVLSVTFTPSDTADYTTVTATVALEVDPAPLTVTANPQTIPFGSPIPILTYTASGFVNGDTTLPGSLETDATSTSPVGSYAITQGNLGVVDVDEDGDTEGNYDITFNGDTVTITQAVPALTWPTPAPINSATPLGAAQLDATANVPGAFSYSPPAGTLLSPGMQTLNLTFTPTDSIDYQTVNDSVAINVNQAIGTSTTLTANSPSPSMYGQPLSFTVDVAGGVPDGEGVSLEDLNTTTIVATGQLNGGTVTIPVNNLPGGTYNLVAVYPGDSTYTTSTSNTVPQEVDQAPKFTSANNTTFTVGGFGSFPVTVLGYPSITLTENPADMPPANVGFDPSTGILSGTPPLGTVGTYTLHFTADNGIGSDATQTFTLTVGKAAPVLTWSPNSPITYGTPLDSTELDATASVAGNFVYTPPAGSNLAVGTPTLSVTFTPTDSADYSQVTQTVQLQVQPAPLTINADQQSIPYGSTVPPLTFTAIGLVNGDTNASLTGALATTVTPTSPVGNYDITQGTLADPNYTITYNDASLTITQAAPTINWPTPGPINTQTPLSGTQLDATSPIPGTFEYDPPAGTLLQAGMQTLSVSFLPNDSTDYAAGYATVQITVTTQNLSISSVAVNGSTAPILGATTSGGTVTIATDGPSGFTTGQKVLIAGVDGTGGASGFNGAFTITGTSGNSFTYSDAAAAGGSTGNGTATTNSAAGLLSNGPTSFNSQRSMVDSLVYTFNQAVSLGASAITISVLGQGGVVPAVSYGSPDGGVTWVVTFSGSGVMGNSIANGEYQVVLNASAVTAVAGGGTLAGNNTESFYRLYGDTVGNGHQRVNTTDTNAFLGTFNTRSTSAIFLAYLDFADSGRINTADTNAFLGDFNTRFGGFAATI